ncbi:MAG: AI-2E family transporter [Candidatus Eremiobacteraeota bacterium]|nr:AI-2E family transporter [Candidatus Eremiobacteraeota bacterium]MBC5828373.1 AI-2E family transporter [Candidatus Eremiobacteraeota bacterium]
MQRITYYLQVVAFIVGVGTAIWMASTVLDRVHTVITIIMLAILFSYLIYPGVKRLSRSMPRALAICVIYAAFIVALVLIGAYLAPTIAEESTQIGKAYPQIANQVQRQMVNPQGSPLLARLPPRVRTLIAENASKAGTYVGAIAAAVGSNIFKFISGTVQAIVEIFVVLVLAFFFIIDLERIQGTTLRMVPSRHRAAAISFAIDSDRVIGGFVRGQALLCLIIAIATTIILFATQVPYAVLLGLLTGIASVVPYVGPIAGAIPAFFIALLAIGFGRALIVLGLFVVVFELQGHLIAPFVVAKSVGVSPLVVLIALLVGAEAYGILGMIIAVPIVGIVRVVQLRLFPEDPEAERLLAGARALSGEPVAPRLKQG